MDKQELTDLCDVFNSAPDIEKFSKIVSGAVENGLSESRIANQFQCASSTVRRWETQTAHPHPFLQEEVVNWIKNNLP